MATEPIEPTRLVFNDAPTGAGPVHLLFGASDAPDVPPAARPTDLVFKDPPVGPGPVRLVFGATGGTDPAPVPVVLTHYAAMPAPGFAMAVVYDNRVTRWRSHSVTAPHQAAAPAAHTLASGWGAPRKELGGIGLHWGSAAPVQHLASTPWRSTAVRQVAAHAPWQMAQPLWHGIGVGFQSAARRQAMAAAIWQMAQPRGITAASGMQTATKLQAHMLARWQSAEHVLLHIQSPLGASTRFIGSHTSLPWTHARRPPPGREAWPPEVITPPTGYVPDTHLLFQCPPLVGMPVGLVFGRHPCKGPVGPGNTIVIPVRRYYVVINDITLRRVDGNYELLAYGLSMSIDRDSWTWSFSATLRADAPPYLEPGSRTEPVELEATINRTPYRLQVEKNSRDTQFGAVRIRISGRGRAAILAAPYAPVLNFGNSAPRTAQQLMADVLTINGVSIGWDVDWGLVDWPVPAGAWAMQGSYIDAITDIAAAAGGYVQPHATDATLRILPSYPKPPWEWDTITPDIELPAAAASVESIEWVDMPAYNRVFLGGVSKGVFGPFKRTGSDGSLLAPPVTHALITHADAHRQRGLSELSNTGRQAHYQLKTQVMPETGIIVPGNFVRYVGGAPVIGIVRGTRLDWSRPVMRQTIGVETHVAA